MKILFLDIDGVLNAARMTDKVKTDGGFMCRDLVKNLDDFLKETECKIVCTSVWRADGKDAIQHYLEQAGAKYAEVIGCTPYGCNICLRGNEIRAWIKETGVIEEDSNDYVIFDDDSDMLLWQQSHFFKVDNHVGLTPNITYQAKRFLEGKGY